ncbi:enoyl-CoA hydratase/isomerase family protein [Nocardia stercoris]|nr:enoyl-CoA hydratase/isomerase family protein [Nocardia stercoris]
MNEVFVLDLGVEGQADTENRLTPDWMNEVQACLDEVERSTGPAGLVTTGTGKFYSLGFEPERFLRPDVGEYLMAGQRLFARVLTLSVPTVAAIRGHVFAGGALFAMAHDQRVMRADRGFFCLPEIDLGLDLGSTGLILPGGMADLLTARLPARTARTAILTGHRYGGVEALDAGIVDAIAGDADATLAAAVSIAAGLARTRGPGLSAMKRWLYRDVLAGLSELALTA